MKHVAQTPEVRQDDLSDLEEAAKARCEAAFGQAATLIEWQRHPAGDFVRAVHLALEASAHGWARKLASFGAQRYPLDPELKRMARILGLPRVMRTDLPAKQAVGKNQEWLREHASEFRGMWVALRAGVLMDSASSVRGLRVRVQGGSDVMVTKVF